MGEAGTAVLIMSNYPQTVPTCERLLLQMHLDATLRLKEEALSWLRRRARSRGGSGRTTSRWPSWKVSDYSASGSESHLRFAGCRITSRIPFGIIRVSALWKKILRATGSSSRKMAIVTKARNRPHPDFS
jgi:hypothetical protein